MPTEYKNLSFPDTTEGRNEMNQEINKLAKQGWTVHSKTVSDEGFNFFKTCCLGCIFLPLALLGKNKNTIQVTMERNAK